MTSRDLSNAAAALSSRLPEPLGVLARLAFNYRWSWMPGGPELFESVDPDRWRRCGRNPVHLLQEAPPSALERAAVDSELLARACEIEERMVSDLMRAPHEGVVEPDRPVAFFCAEYAVHPSLPIYSGGLGALAGDILKEASDRALPFVAVGLLYRQGYFHQHVDAWGRQREHWRDCDPERLPAALVTADDGRALTVTVPIGDGDLVAQIWRVDVGRVPLFLLDADIPENTPAGRWTTARLYNPDPEVRLAQYALLGVGGTRALEALGIEPGVIHLNEGHAALAALEVALCRAPVVFTTHTPVPAGNDTYPADHAARMLGRFAFEVGLESKDLVSLGRTNMDDPSEPFGVTQLALRTSGAANAVSRRHGQVAREMWQDLGVPITHVTNGVHVPTWLGEPMRRVLERHLGPDWLERIDQAGVDAIPDAELWAARCEQRADLVAFARQRSVEDRLERGEPRDYAEAAARGLDPEALTLGFARRVATYKRLHLMLQDRDRAMRLLSGDRPIQVLLAGKAHPSDDNAKRLIQELFAVKDVRAVQERVVFLADYELDVAARMVRGCDVWVNLPRPPLEASGTSGMKASLNGGLQLSVLDGWWAEAHDGTNGWALSGDVDDDHVRQDARDAGELYRLLEDEVVPVFYGRDGEGLPSAWLALVRASLATLARQFGAGRMLADYEERMYAPVSRLGAVPRVADVDLTGASS